MQSAVGAGSQVRKLGDDLVSLNLLKSLSMRWWQIGVFKVGMLAVGLIIGATWPGVVFPMVGLLAVLAVVSLSYVTWIWARQ